MDTRTSSATVDPGGFGLSVVDGRMAVSCAECSWTAPAGDTVQSVVERSVRHQQAAHPALPPPLESFDGAKLVYIERDENVAYFSSDPDPMGDDWNDAPWEYNAGPPYKWDAQVGWFGGSFERPGYGSLNSTFSVDMINAGAVPWLSQHYRNDPVVIPAGVGVGEFMRLIAEGGGYPVVIPPDAAD